MKFPTSAAAAVKLLTLNGDLPGGGEDEFPCEDQQMWTISWGLETTTASFRKAGDSLQSKIWDSLL